MRRHGRVRRTRPCHDVPVRKLSAQWKIDLDRFEHCGAFDGEIGKRFEMEFPRARIDVQSGGSSRGIADVRQGLADLGMVCNP